MNQNIGNPIPASMENTHESHHGLVTNGRIEKECNTIRTIMIRQLNHGYIIEVGCQTLAIESSTRLVALLSEYIYNPSLTEKKYNEGDLI